MKLPYFLVSFSWAYIVQLCAIGMRVKIMLFPLQDNSCDSMSHGRRERSEIHAKADIQGDSYIIITVLSRWDAKEESPFFPLTRLQFE